MSYKFRINEERLSGLSAKREDNTLF